MMALSPSQRIRYSRYGMCPFNWIVEGEIIASVYPASMDYLKHMKEVEGVTLAVNLTRNNWPDEWIYDSGLKYLHHPVDDMMVPSVDDIKDIINRIDDNRGATMIHCAAGIGRTGTVIGVYLVEKGMDPEEAIMAVRRKRAGSIQTTGQENLIRKWHRLRS